MENKQIGMIGAGAWGTAVAKVLAENGHDVEIWAFEKSVADSINTRHVNNTYLLGVELPPVLRATDNLNQAVSGKEFIFLAVPSIFFIPTLRQIAKNPAVLDGSLSIGILTKGFIPGRRLPYLPVEAAENLLPIPYRDKLVYISGPSHAEEVSRGKITGLISASKNAKNSIRFRELLSGRTLLVYSSFDVIGVQTAAAVKNVIALSFGMLDALKEISPLFGDNTESLLLAAGLREIQLLGQALGSAYPETYTSIAAVGDLDVTCRSVYGRNRRFGREIIHDRKLEGFKDIDDLIKRIATVGYLPEGVVACRYARSVAEQKNLKTPIISAVHSILNRESEPLETLSSLIGNSISFPDANSSDGFSQRDDGHSPDEDRTLGKR
jgi:glycerol-3-phosphate dehydrogenase (NAD(P)+)